MEHVLNILLMSGLLVPGEIGTVQADYAAEKRCEAKHFAPGIISDTGHEVFRGTFSPDNSRFAFFRSREGQENYGIYENTLTEAQEWSEPVRLILGEESSDFYPSYSLDGARLIFSSYRGVRSGETRATNANLWISYLGENEWSAPTLIEELSTPDQYDNRAHFLADGTIRFSSTSSDWSETHEYVATMSGEGFSTPQTDSDRAEFRDWAQEHPRLHLWNSDLSPNGKMAILEVSPINADGRPGPADLWVAHKTNGVWSAPQLPKAQINTEEGNENFPTFTADNKVMTFVRDFKSFYQIPAGCLLGDN